MPDRPGSQPWREIEEIVGRSNPAELDAFLDTLAPSDVARAISRLDDEVRAHVLTLLEPEDAADLMEELSDAQGADILEDLPAHQAAAIVDEMESDERADVLAELDVEDAEAILSRMDPEEAEDARALLRYEPDTAGGIMVTEFLAYPMDQCVSDVLDDLRENAELYSDFGVQYAYALNEQGSLVGVLRLRDLVLAPSSAPLNQVMIPNPIYVEVDTPLEDVDHFFDRYTFVGVPVIDAAGKLVGVLRRGDAEEAISERSDKAFMQFGGIVGGEELRSMSVFERSFRRMSWLTLNLILSLGAATIILFFEPTIEKFVLLAFFIPVIGNMSGCSGNQAVAVSIREMALGLIKPQDYLRVLAKEAQVGVLNGLALGVLIAGIAFLVGSVASHSGSGEVATGLGVAVNLPLLALVVGCALGLNTLVALSLGGLVPLLLRALRVDPALSAPPIVMTLSDMCGFAILLGLATWLLV